MKSLPQRISDAVWASEWPAGAELGVGIPLAKQALPQELDWPWERARSVLQAIGGESSPVPLEVAHQFFDDLESWTVRHRAFLSWPPTPEGFANALVHSAKTKDIGVVGLLAVYPGFCHEMLEKARRSDPSYPPLGGLFGDAARGYAPRPPRPAAVLEEAAGEPKASPEPSEAPAPATASPSRVSSPPAVPEPAHPKASTPVPEPVRQESGRTESARSPYRPEKPVPKVVTPPAEFLLKWVEKAKESAPSSTIRQALDHQIKTALGTAGVNPWTWFDKTLLPELIKLPEQDLALLLDHWPAHNRFSPPDAVEWVDRTRFWGLMRDAGPDRRAILCEGGLAKLVNVDSISNEARLEMATKMFPFTANKAEPFRQRLALWSSLGGELDAPVRPAAESADESLRYQEMTSLRKWVAEQGDNEWNSVLESLAAPAPSTAPERFRRMGPG